MLSREEIKRLEKNFLFADFFKTEKGKEKLSRFLDSECCRVLDIPKGTTVFGPNGENELGILLEGKAEAVCSAEDKGSLKIFSSGETFGAASVFCKDASFAKVKAKTACRVLFITKKGVKSIISDIPETAFKYIGFLSDRVEFLNRRIATFTSNQATKRLAGYILENEKQTLNVNFAALARSLDISRASLYRARNELEEIGAIKASLKNIEIVNKETLKSILK